MATGFRRTLCLLLLVLDCAGTNRQVQRHLDISLSFPRDAEMTTNALVSFFLYALSLHSPLGIAFNRYESNHSAQLPSGSWDFIRVRSRPHGNVRRGFLHSPYLGVIARVCSKHHVHQTLLKIRFRRGIRAGAIDAIDPAHAALLQCYITVYQGLLLRVKWVRARVLSVHVHAHQVNTSSQHICRAHTAQHRQLMLSMLRKENQ